MIVRSPCVLTVIDDPHAFFIGIMGTHDYMLNNCLADYVWKSFKIREIRMNELNV